MPYPPAPTEVPLILRPPGTAHIEARLEVKALTVIMDAALARAEEGDYQKAIDLITVMDANDAIQKLKVARNGDINVDSFVRNLIPNDGSWVHLGIIDNEARSLDRRLTTNTYQSASSSWRQLSPVDVVIERLLTNHTLRKHGGSSQVRLTTPVTAGKP